MSAVPSSRRTVLLLAACQALAMTGTSIVATTASIVGSGLTADKALSTLPIATQMTGIMTATIPAALLMGKIGRRGGFWCGTAIGATGAAVACGAIFTSSFPLLCLGTFLMGGYNGFAQQYRFAASEIADEAFRSKAISLVLAGGVVSGLFGPEAAKWSSELFAPVTYAGCYAAIVVLCVAAATLLCFVHLPPPPAVRLSGSGRPLREIATQPLFVAAVLAGMIGYGTMSFIMTATPIAMLGCGFAFPDAAFVIQWHALGMYAPSFVTGHLIARFGVTNVLLAGAALLLVCCGINLSGVAKLDFWSALVLLGIGWNFLFVGATTLLTRTYRPSEKAKVQALNDFLIFGTVALCSFGSGALLDGAGWHVVQLAVVPFAAATAGGVIWIKLRAGRSAPNFAQS